MKKIPRPRRSVLYVPASNPKALQKSVTLAADAIIYDLEDSVAPEAKEAAREALRTHFREHPIASRERIIRINSLASQWGSEDILAARACNPDAILLPKVEHPRDVIEAANALDETDAADTLALWAMIETPRGILNADEVAQLGSHSSARLACFVVGSNDIARETGVDLGGDRKFLIPWLMQIVLAARAGGLDILDGVYNDFADAEGFKRECRQGAAMGFDGKTLIHPSQIETANHAFSASETEIAEARAIVELFMRPENAGKGVLPFNGRMVERLHLAMAETVLAKANMIATSDKDRETR
ncbi:ATP-binding protein [Paramesorhizobium deserti]|uniref:ATP-binding protein n=1 Tax=Paramesorhizobium deserti TaxID=1494590 RepID=A0A135I1S1_9HYPH|nr:CoA ester lyase [Paramesorhizobium deserti]KXF79368.1 ATP-binding protein [Paramesorhizobium deserti]